MQTYELNGFLRTLNYPSTEENWSISTSSFHRCGWGYVVTHHIFGSIWIYLDLFGHHISGCRYRISVNSATGTTWFLQNQPTQLQKYVEDSGGGTGGMRERTPRKKTERLHCVFMDFILNMRKNICVFIQTRPFSSHWIIRSNLKSLRRLLSRRAGAQSFTSRRLVPTAALVCWL